MPAVATEEYGGGAVLGGLGSVVLFPRQVVHFSGRSSEREHHGESGDADGRRRGVFWSEEINAVYIEPGAADSKVQVLGRPGEGERETGERETGEFAEGEFRFVYAPGWAPGCFARREEVRRDKD